MINEILESLLKWLGPISAIGRDRRELKDLALRSIATALTETSLYYRDLGRGAGRNMDTEAMLAKYWSAAAIPLRHFDRPLSERCQNKSDYWISPERYSDKEVLSLGIRLNDVKEAYRTMLRPTRFSLPFATTQVPSKTKKKSAAKRKAS